MPRLFQNCLISAGLKAPVRPRIRDEIWVKLWGNCAFNPISALTMTTLDRITGDPELRTLCRGMMLEAKSVAEALGIRFAIDVEKRIDGAAEVGEHKTSMLQDLERGRPMEIDALLGCGRRTRWLGGAPHAALPIGARAGTRTRSPRRLLPLGAPTMISVAVLGAGRIGQIHARNVAAHSDARLAGVMDVASAAAQRLAQSLGSQPISLDQAFAADATHDLHAYSDPR